MPQKHKSPSGATTSEGAKEENLTSEYKGLRARIKEIFYLIGSHEILPAATVTAILRFFKLEGA